MPILTLFLIKSIVGYGKDNYVQNATGCFIFSNLGWLQFE
jgi:hypothetical protein